MNLLVESFMGQFVSGKFVLKIGKASKITIGIDDETENLKEEQMKIGWCDNSNDMPANIPSVIIARDAPIYKDTYGSKGYYQYFHNDPMYIVLKDCNNYYMVRHHSLNEGVTGFFRKCDVEPYCFKE